MSLGKKVGFAILGIIGIIAAASGLNGVGMMFHWWGDEILQYAFSDLFGYSLMWVVVGGFLIYISIKQLRKGGKTKKVVAKLLKSNGDEPEYLEFQSVQDLHFWYKTNTNWEGVENVTVVRR